jgi:hypothetical protein
MQNERVVSWSSTFIVHAASCALRLLNDIVFVGWKGKFLYWQSVYNEQRHKSTQWHLNSSSTSLHECSSPEPQPPPPPHPPSTDQYVLSNSSQGCPSYCVHTAHIADSAGHGRAHKSQQLNSSTMQLYPAHTHTYPEVDCGRLATDRDSPLLAAQEIFDETRDTAVSKYRYTYVHISIYLARPKCGRTHRLLANSALSKLMLVLSQTWLKSPTATDWIVRVPCW